MLVLVLVVAASSRLFVAVVTSNRRRVLRDETEMRLTPGPECSRAAGTSVDAGGASAKKIEPDPGAPKYLVSEPWVGYRFVTEGGTPLTSATGSH
jgi:hypothetical protein